MASLTIPLLTEKDQEILRAFLDRVRHLQPPPGNSAYDDDDMAPEVYVARSPADGILALSEQAGTAFVDTPGSATCTVYRIVVNAGVKELRPVTGLTRTIHNLSTIGVVGNSWILVARDKFGTWWVVEEAGTGAGHYIKCVNTTPDADGYFDATYMVKIAGGSIIDTGAAVYLREANSAPLLLLNEVYHAHVTGAWNGRSVFTTGDFNLICEEGRVDDVGTGYGDLPRTNRLRFFPDTDWEVTRPTGTPNQRTTQVRYIAGGLTVREEGGSPSYSSITIVTLSPANAWVLTQPAAGEVLVQRTLNVFEGSSQRNTTDVYKITFDNDDFDLVGGGGEVTVNTNGVTETFYLLSSCVAGVLKKRQLVFVRGLLDSIGGEVDA